MSRLKQLAKDASIYGIGGAIAKSVSFFLLPVYTRIFTPDDYGTIEMLRVIVSFISAFLVMGMDSAQSFYFFEQKKEGKTQQKIVVSAILQWRLIWGGIIVVIAGSLAPLVNAWLFNAKLPLHYFAVAFSGALFSTILSQSVSIFRLLYRPWSFITVTLINTLLSAGLVLTLVLMFEAGIYGYFLGTTLASLVMAVFAWYLVRDYLDFSGWHSQWWPRILKFGAPLLPSGLAYYAMSTADRWFIQYYHGSEALGLYAVGAKFALVMALAIETFRKAWWPVAMDAMHSDDGPETFRIIARLYMGLGVAAVVYLTFLSPWLVKWMTGSQYHNAYSIVGVLAWQSLFYGFFLVGSAGIWRSEKTYITAILMCIAGVMNVVLNYLWVPEYGGMGSAVATVVAYFFWNVMSIMISEHFWCVDFPMLLMGGQVGLGSVVVTILILGDLPIETTIILTHAIVVILLASSLDFKHWYIVLMKTRRLLNFV